MWAHCDGHNSGVGPKLIAVRRIFCVALVLVVVASACTGSDEVAREGDIIVESGDTSVFEMRPGDCLYPGEELDEQVKNLPGMPCLDPHTHEVFAVWEAGDPDAFSAAADLDIGTYPGEGKLDDWAELACLTSFPTYVDANYFDSDLFITHLLPTLDGWQDDDMEIICLARTTGWLMASSIHCSSGLQQDLLVPLDTPPLESSTSEERAAAYLVPPDEACVATSTSGAS